MQYIILGVLILLGILFTRSRGISVGLLVADWILFAFNRGNVDYKNYMINYQSAHISSIFTTIEGGFAALIVLLRDYLNISYEGFRLVISSIALLLMYASIIRYTKNHALAMALFSIFPMLISIVQIRNFFAFSIIFWGLRYLERNDALSILKYCVCVLLAMSIHISCAFYFLFILCKIADAKKLFTVVSIWCVTGIPVILSVGERLTALRERYWRYFYFRTSVVTQVLMLFYLGFATFIAFTSAKYLKEYILKLSSNGETVSNYIKRSCIFADLTYKISIIGFATWPLVVINSEFMRLSRHILILVFTSFSIAASYRTKTRMQYFLRLIVIVFALASMWYFEIYGKMGLYVFWPCMEENEIITFLF